jgi:hypothetical protein
MLRCINIRRLAGYVYRNIERRVVATIVVVAKQQILHIVCVCVCVCVCGVCVYVCVCGVCVYVCVYGV